MSLRLFQRKKSFSFRDATTPVQALPRRKSVSFGDASLNTVHIIENYRLTTMNSPKERNKIWYNPKELVQLSRADRINHEQYKAIAASPAYKATCLSKRKPNSISPNPSSSSGSSHSTKKDLLQQKDQTLRELQLVAYKDAYLSKRKASSVSPIPCASLGSPSLTKKKQSQQKALALSELRLVASVHSSNNISHQEKLERNSNITRAPREAPTIRPSCRDRCRRRYYQIHTTGKNIGRVRAVYYSS